MTCFYRGGTELVLKLGKILKTLSKLDEKVSADITFEAFHLINQSALNIKNKNPKTENRWRISNKIWK